MILSLGMRCIRNVTAAGHFSTKAFFREGENGVEETFDSSKERYQVRIMSRTFGESPIRMLSPIGIISIGQG